jgi:DNA-binding NarL/FixJ family response regulator
VERSTAASVFPSDRVHDDALVPRRLTRREAEIVDLVSQGLQNKKIAERLSITDTTVRHHLTSIFEKLSVTNRLELMRFAYDGQHSSSIVRP